MTVRINKPALNLREELTKAQGVVRYEQRQFWMDGLVENGTFDTPDGWILDGFSISGGKLVKVAGTGNSKEAVYPVSLQTGKKYIAKFDYTQIGSSSIRFGYGLVATSLTTIIIDNTTGAKEISFTADDSYNYVGFQGHDSYTGEIDNFRLFELDENDNVIQSLPLGFKPVHVYEDGLLQREGTNHDYTVVDTGFGYQVKPTVAPSATTETCIIAEREL